MKKENFVKVFESTGIDAAMREKWHGEFERLYPKDHREFLKFLELGDDEISKIRAKCKP